MPTRSALTAAAAATQAPAPGRPEGGSRLPDAAERDVRPPLAGSREPLDGADDLAGGDDDSQVAPGEDELWTSAPCPAGHLRADSSSRQARTPARSEHLWTSMPQLPNRGLTTNGGSSVGRVCGCVTCRVVGCGTPAS